MSESSFCPSQLCNFLINGLIDCVHCQSKEEITYQARSINAKRDIRHSSVLISVQQYFNLVSCFTVTLKEDGSKTIHSSNIILWLLLNQYSIHPMSGNCHLCQVFLEVRTARCGLKVPQGDCSAVTAFSETHLLLTENN